MRHRPIALIVLDGWGHREETEANAVWHARTPNFDRLWHDYPHTLMQTSGEAVGLPTRQMGNSEVGHLNLGAGRVLYQDSARISKAIETGEFQHNEALLQAIRAARDSGSALHILGLLSPGGVHSNEAHIRALFELAVAEGIERIYLHAFLDGRDTAPRYAEASLRGMMERMEQAGCGRIASIIGRYHAMDRDRRWDRTAAAYHLIVRGEAPYRAHDPVAGLHAAYERGEGDEFVRATVVAPEGEAPAVMADGDAVVFMNFRADRSRQLTQALIESGFDGFDAGERPRFSAFVTLTQYREDFNVPVAFPPSRPRNGFGEFVASQGLRQLRIAETEKYAHVTFFFNGGEDAPFPGEDRILVPSPKVATYDEQPEMSAPELTRRLVEAIRGGTYDTIICNYANPDMVGHSGDFDAVVKAIEAVDACLGQVADAIQSVGGEAIITADHGNAEQLSDPQTGQPHTSHTTNPVPLIYMGRPATLREAGILADIAPSLLYLMELVPPPEMTGRSLISLQEDADASQEA